MVLTILLTLIMMVLLWETMKKSIRERTIANGDPVCDYWIAGDQIKGAR